MRAGGGGCGLGCKQSNAPFLNPYMKSSGQCPMATALGKLPNFPYSMFSVEQAIPSSGLDQEDAEVCRSYVSQCRIFY